MRIKPRDAISICFNYWYRFVPGLVPYYFFGLTRFFKEKPGGGRRNYFILQGIDHQQRSRGNFSYKMNGIHDAKIIEIFTGQCFGAPDQIEPTPRQNDHRNFDPGVNAGKNGADDPAQTDDKVTDPTGIQ